MKLLKTNKFPKHDGFTLIELVVTVGVFTTGIMAAFTLALSNLNTAKDNYQRVSTANLAREGIELVRNIRDSNWLRLDANADCDPALGLQLCTWDKYLYNGINTFFTVDYLNNISALTCNSFNNLDTCFTNCVDGLSGSDSCRLYFDANGFYTRTVTGNTPVNFYRVIKIQSICWDSSGVESFVNDAACNSGEKVGIKVTSRVGWKKGSDLKYLDAIEYLYNWRH